MWANDNDSLSWYYCMRRKSTPKFFYSRRTQGSVVEWRIIMHIARVNKVSKNATPKLPAEVWPTTLKYLIHEAEGNRESIWRPTYTKTNYPLCWHIVMCFIAFFVCANELASNFSIGADGREVDGLVFMWYFLVEASPVGSILVRVISVKWYIDYRFIMNVICWNIHVFM